MNKNRLVVTVLLVLFVLSAHTTEAFSLKGFFNNIFGKKTAPVQQGAAAYRSVSSDSELQMEATIDQPEMTTIKTEEPVKESTITPIRQPVTDTPTVDAPIKPTKTTTIDIVTPIKEPVKGEIKQSTKEETVKPTKKIKEISNTRENTREMSVVYKIVKFGMKKDSDVKTVQNRLISLGFSKGPADGNYGRGTVASVSAFQASVGIPVDGMKVNEKTLTAMRIRLMQKTTAGQGMIVSLSSATPPAQSIQAGSQNVKIAEYDYTSDCQCNITIEEFNFLLQQTNLTSPAQVSNFKLMINGVQAGQTIVSPAVYHFGTTANTNNVFGDYVAGTPLNIVFQPGEVKKISLYVDINSTAPIGTQINIPQFGSSLFDPNGPTIDLQLQWPGESNIFTVGSQSQISNITVVSPNGGETYQAGQQITVNWTSSNIIGPVGVSLITPAPGGYAGWVLSNSYSNTGQGIFTLPTASLPYGQNFKISVYSTQFQPPSYTYAIADDSDNLFTINAPQQTCVINSFNANPTTVLSGGASTLSWTTTGCGNNPITINHNGNAYAMNSSMTTGPLTSTTSYTLSASSQSGCIGDMYSATTGQLCSYQTQTVTVIVNSNQVTDEVLFLGGTNSVGGAHSYNDVYNNLIPGCLSTLGFSTITGQPCTNAGSTWSQISANTSSTSQWSGRFNPQALYYNNKYWIIGGSAGSVARLTDIWNSSDGVTWTKVSSTVPFSAYYRYKAIVFDNKIYVIGGRTNYSGGIASAKMWSTTDGINWTTTTLDGSNGAPSLLEMENPTLGVLNGKLFVVGGVEKDGPEKNIWQFNGSAWALLQSLPDAISDAKILNYDGYMYMVGGMLWNSAGTGSTTNKTIWRSNGAQWIPISDTFPSGSGPSSEIDSFVANGKMWVGDFADVNPHTNHLWSSTDGITWTQYQGTLPWSPRHGYKMIVK